MEQHRLKTTKKQIVKELRSAERKRKRLRERARQLTDEDLLSAMLMRKEKKKGSDGRRWPRRRREQH